MWQKKIKGLLQMTRQSEFSCTRNHERRCKKPPKMSSVGKWKEERSMKEKAEFIEQA